MKWNNRSKLESELIRREWRLQRQRIKAHQRRKEILIKEYEIQRKRKLKRSTEDMSLFKGPEGTQIDLTELHKIKVHIYNIPGKSVANDEVQRDIINPEDVIVKRREGEGARPIFDREELTRKVSNTEDVTEYRKVRTVEDANLEDKPQTSNRRSASLSLTRSRSHSYRRTSPSHSRHEDYNQGNREYRRSSSNRGRSRDRSSRERKEDRRRTQSCYVEGEEQRLKERRNRRSHSRSRERDRPKWNRDPHHNKSIRSRSRERRMLTQPIPVIEQVPVPIYYGNFLPRSLIVGPLVPTRGQVAFGGSRPMWPIRPFGPRFPPGIYMYRLRPPGNPRGFGPRYY